MKLGTAILALVVLLAIGSVLAPFAAAIYAISVFSLSEIVKGVLILYVALIPVSMLANRG
jgi:hypothetical protein